MRRYERILLLLLQKNNLARLAERIGFLINELLLRILTPLSIPVGRPPIAYPLMPTPCLDWENDNLCSSSRSLFLVSLSFYYPSYTSSSTTLSRKVDNESFEYLMNSRQEGGQYGAIAQWRVWLFKLESFPIFFFFCVNAKLSFRPQFRWFTTMTMTTFPRPPSPPPTTKKFKTLFGGRVLISIWRPSNRGGEYKGVAWWRRSPPSPFVIYSNTYVLFIYQLLTFWFKLIKWLKFNKIFYFIVKLENLLILT